MKTPIRMVAATGGLLALSSVVHELSHTVAIKLTGGQCTTSLTMTHITSHPTMPYGYQLSCFAGGFITFLIFLLLYYLTKQPVIRLPIKLIAAYQLTYAFIELFRLPYYIDITASLFTITFVLFTSNEIIFRLFEEIDS